MIGLLLAGSEGSAGRFFSSIGLELELWLWFWVVGAVREDWFTTQSLVGFSIAWNGVLWVSIAGGGPFPRYPALLCEAGRFLVVFGLEARGSCDELMSGLVLSMGNEPAAGEVTGRSRSEYGGDDDDGLLVMISEWFRMWSFFIPVFAPGVVRVCVFVCGRVYVFVIRSDTLDGGEPGTL